MEVAANNVEGVTHNEVNNEHMYCQVDCLLLTMFYLWRTHVILCHDPRLVPEEVFGLGGCAQSRQVLAAPGETQERLDWPRPRQVAKELHFLELVQTVVMHFTQTQCRHCSNNSHSFMTLHKWYIIVLLCVSEQFCKINHRQKKITNIN